MKNKKKYIIKDWCGNHLFKEKVFGSPDEAWEYVTENVDNSLFEETGNDNDDNLQEYLVHLKK